MVKNSAQKQGLIANRGQSGYADNTIANCLAA
ncbi:hypothetical protein CBM2608_U150008 [Cupriavidus taiwanensis]|nr:hypothetical protein CBM2608_U150008 [Cupriavidus taiwanensis]SOZ78346.1 hypothetical protein CBM2617_U50006 [Cupriavidus taiwanensis]SPA53929.1 hypothetical protein CBM2629_U80001 [Cupriavidus taiwanensis]SPD37264.1 protein of unknown function [Cupriavidus taiwanensis]